MLPAFLGWTEEHRGQVAESPHVESAVTLKLDKHEGHDDDIKSDTVKNIQRGRRA